MQVLTLFSNDLAGFQMFPNAGFQHVYAVVTILDDSKILLYDFYYNVLKNQYGTKCELIYTDTDSFLLEIQTDDVYKDMEGSKYHFDTSDYPKGHPPYSSANKNVLGKTEDEINGMSIVECVCLRRKMYSNLTENKNIKTSKGTKHKW